jgi:hypothetical protein
MANASTCVRPVGAIPCCAYHSTSHAWASVPGAVAYGYRLFGSNGACSRPHTLQAVISSSFARRLVRRSVPHVPTFRVKAPPRRSTIGLSPSGPSPRRVYWVHVRPTVATRVRLAAAPADEGAAHRTVYRLDVDAPRFAPFLFCRHRSTSLPVPQRAGWRATSHSRLGLETETVAYRSGESHMKARARLTRPRPRMCTLFVPVAALPLRPPARAPSRTYRTCSPSLAVTATS